MKQNFYWLLAFIFFMVMPGTSWSQLRADTDTGEYKIIVEGFDWGPAVSKVVLLGHNPDDLNEQGYEVTVKRSTALIEIPEERAMGTRDILHAYRSDENGANSAGGNSTTLILEVGPGKVLGSPFQYIRNDSLSGNFWVDYTMHITQHATGKVWSRETARIMPLVDSFELNGSYTHSDGISYSYASYDPQRKQGKSPLIIWLHGGGEGGSDPTIPLLGNRAANYASGELQHFFGGAHVLVPQCPTAWMHNKEGVSTRGRENDIYNEGLMALIRKYVQEHPDIDPDRIYIGGCSNGGYMSLKLILLYPDYFAAGFISALAYNSEFLSDSDIQKIKEVPIWFIHAEDDPVTLAEETAVPVYKRLISAGAENVHFSYYKHVEDISGILGGKNFRYNGHWSWIYSHANHSRKDYDGSPVMVDNRPVTIMEWMAAMKN